MICLFSVNIDQITMFFLFGSEFFLEIWVIDWSKWNILKSTLWNISINSVILNTSYLTDSYITFTLKLESGQKFCCNRSIRSSTYGKKKYFWNSSMREPFSFNSFYLLVLRKITNSLTKMTNFPHGGKSEIFFLPYVLDLIDLLEQKFCPDSKLRVKLMYESVK